MVKFPRYPLTHYWTVFALLFATSCASTTLAYRSSEGLLDRVIADYAEKVVSADLLLPGADDAVLANEALKELEKSMVEEQAATEEEDRLEQEPSTVVNIEPLAEVRMAGSSFTSMVDPNQGNQAGSSVTVEPVITPAQPTAAPAQPTAAPVQPTAAPAQPTAAPAQPTAPARPPAVQTPIAPPLPDISPPIMLPADDTSPSDSITDGGPRQLNTMIVDTVKGKEFVITLEGDRWFPQTSRIDPAFTFLGKDFDQQERSVFRFKLNKVGVFTINFNRNSLNGLEIQAVKINVTDLLDRQVDPLVSNTVPSTPSDLSLEDNLALLAPSVITELDDKAIDSAVGNLDEKELKKLFDEVLAGDGREDLADTMLKQFSERFPRSNLLPKMIYELALAYEQEGPMRNIERSYDYYKKVYDRYPISPYSRMSKERLDYLDRFYFKIS